MQHHHGQNLGNRIQSEGMRIQAQSQMRPRHGKRALAKARWSLFLSIIAAIVALLMWLAG